MSIDKITPEDYEIEEQCDFGTNMTDEEWDKQIDASPLQKQVGGSHYKNMKIQPSQFINENRLPFAEGSAIKYICRHAAKGKEQDIDKAIHYLEMIKERDYV